MILFDFLFNPFHPLLPLQINEFFAPGAAFAKDELRLEVVVVGVDVFFVGAGAVFGFVAGGGDVVEGEEGEEDGEQRGEEDEEG